MGDMADMLIEQGIAEMTDQDYEPDLYDRRDYDRFVHHPMTVRTTQCKYCHTVMLRWTQTDAGWRLQTLKGNIHSCKAYEKHMENGDSNG